MIVCSFESLQYLKLIFLHSKVDLHILHGMASIINPSEFTNGWQ